MFSNSQTEEFKKQLEQLNAESSKLNNEIKNSIASESLNQNLNSKSFLLASVEEDRAKAVSNFHISAYPPAVKKFDARYYCLYNLNTTPPRTFPLGRRASYEALVLCALIMYQKRTFVYIDGFNLYYGCLKNSPFKWLDLKALFSSLLDASHDIQKIKYYTAQISSREGNNDSRLRQKYYLQAISQYTSEIEIFYGHYLSHEINAKVVKPPPNFIKVYKTEEKGSDVNLALHVLNDAWMNLYDCAVIVSNDSDLSEALRLVKNLKTKTIGLIFPNTNYKRKPSRELSKYADFIKHIRSHLLEKSQLPINIPGTNIYKPQAW